jgi:hypothetical protein
MPRVILQPAGGNPASDHYKKTILSPVSLRRCAEFITAMDVAELAAVYGRDGARVWGVTPGDNFRNKKKWELIDPGDAVLFCGKGEVFSYAFVKHKLHSRTLALDLWDKDPKGQTWEYIYFVSEPETMSIRYDRLASVLEFSQDFVVMGFMVLSGQKSARVLQEFGLADD